MQSSPLFIRFAPWLFIFIWSCGFIVAKYVTPYAPALTFLSLRYLGIAVLMASLAYWAGVQYPRGKILLHTFVAGILMQAGYLAGCWIGIAQGMPSGVMALITNLQPVLTAIFTALALKHTDDSVTRRQWLGLILGFSGVAIVLSTKLTASAHTSFGWLAIGCALGALSSITIGTLYQKHFCPGIDPRSSQTMQSIASLVITVPFAVSFETQAVQWVGAFWAALAFSIFVLSGMGTSLLLWLIDKGAATQVTAYLYWVPPVSCLLAWILFDERITTAAWPGFLLVGLGVYLVVNGVKSPKKTPDVHHA